MANLAQLGTGTLTSGFTKYGNRGDIGLGLLGTTARPYSLAEQKALQLKRETWLNELRALSTTNDVFETGMAEVVTNMYEMGISIPDAVGMKISVGGENSAVTIPVYDPLGGRPLAGNARLLSNEKGLTQRYVQAYYNEVKDGIMTQTRGVDYNYENTFGLYEQATPALTKYWKETKGRMKRQCLVEVYNDELLSNNPGVTITQHLNPLWFINGDSVVATKTDDNGVPLWDQDVNVYMDRVAEAMITGGAATATVDATFLDKISHLASSEYIIEPVSDDEYILVIPQPQYYNLTEIDSKLNTYWQHASSYSGVLDVFKGEWGKYRNLRIVPDNRWVGAVVTPETTALDDATIAFTYKEPGNEDSRDKSAYVSTTNEVFQLGFLLGKGAYIERMEKDLYVKFDEQNYQEDRGVGTFMEVGYNLNMIKIDPTGSNEYPDYVESRSSAVVVFPGARV